jgi:hypothetical protein
MAIPAYPANRSWRKSMQDMRDTLFVVIYQLVFQLMTLFRRWNY